MKNHHWLAYVWGLLLVPIVLLGTSGCQTEAFSAHTPLKVALLMEGPADDDSWNAQALAGLRDAQEKWHIELAYEEYLLPDEFTEVASKYAEDGYQLIFGHGSNFTKAFNEVAPEYPKSHFIFFNGDTQLSNVTSANFTPQSIGFFMGMVAALTPGMDHIGVIPAYDSMQEIPSFLAAVKRFRPDAEVQVTAVGDWHQEDRAMSIAEAMIEKNVDLLVPMGDAYNVQVIQRARQAGIHAMGYISDMSYLGKETVLTSGIQEVRQLYLDLIEQYMNKGLPGGNLFFDFDDGVQQLGVYGDDVPEAVQREVEKAIEQYKNRDFKLGVDGESTEEGI